SGSGGGDKRYSVDRRAPAITGAHRQPLQRLTGDGRGREGSGVVVGLAPADAGRDEAVELAVEDGRRVADLVARAQILDELLTVEEVRAHLVAPARGDGAGELLLLGRLLLLLQQ